ncbi:MAG: hypothetical protein ABJN22_08385 [Litorimonas sp.]
MIKAGGAGANPVSDSKNPSPILKDYLSNIGHNVHYLNTICVGLDAVSNGHPKPDGLNISWSTKDPKLSAIKSRRFAVDASLIFLAEANYSYLLSIAQLNEKLGRDSGLSKSGEKKSEFMMRICEELTKTTFNDDERFLLHVPALTMDWRNSIVHSKSKPKPSRYKIFKDYEKYLASKYKNLSVSHLLDHFEKTRATLKDASCLISMSVRLIRYIDEVAYSCDDKKSYLQYLHAFEIFEKMKRLKKNKTPERLNASINMMIQSEFPFLIDAHKLYFDEHEDWN